jgi:hypothetical protein
MQVIRHIRYKYVCKNCEGVDANEPAVKIAAAPIQLIPKSIATARLLAYVITAKFVDALPFYRQEKQFARMRVDISRSTMCGWAIKAAEKCDPLLELFHNEILSGPLIKAWLDIKSIQTPPKGLLGQGISYTLNQWHRLVRYLKDARLKPDNNLAENAVRPFVVGRKNWLFSGNPAGAKASATLYSLIESAKANGLEPYQYLRFLFDRMPLAQSQEDYKALLPNKIDKNLVADASK